MITLVIYRILFYYSILFSRLARIIIHSDVPGCHWHALEIQAFFLVLRIMIVQRSDIIQHASYTLRLLSSPLEGHQTLASAHQSPSKSRWHAGIHDKGIFRLYHDTIFGSCFK